MTRSIRQTVTIGAAPRKVYEALISEKKHAKFTGAKAAISRKVGGAFTCYGTHLSGINLDLVPGKEDRPGLALQRAGPRARTRSPRSRSRGRSAARRSSSSPRTGSPRRPTCTSTRAGRPTTGSRSRPTWRNRPLGRPEKTGRGRRRLPEAWPRVLRRAHRPPRVFPQGVRRPAPLARRRVLRRHGRSVPVPAGAGEQPGGLCPGNEAGGRGRRRHSLGLLRAPVRGADDSVRLRRLLDG